MNEAHFQMMTPFQPNWWNRLTTWPASWWQRRQFANLRACVLFVGYPRTGHSLIGSLLNAHRHALIAHELNLLHYVKRGFSRTQLCRLMWRQDQAFEQIGRSWTDYDYRVPGQWQGRWEELRYIGDKHANGASKLLGLRPDLIDRLQDRLGIPVRLLHVVRHPLDTISTMARRNAKGQTLPHCVEEYLSLCDVNQNLCERYGPSLLTLHLEELIGQPLTTLTRLTQFLEMETDPAYLQACCSLIRPRESHTRSLVEWPPALLAQVAERQRLYPFLQRYRAQRAGGDGAASRAA